MFFSPFTPKFSFDWAGDKKLDSVLSYFQTPLSLWKKTLSRVVFSALFFFFLEMRWNTWLSCFIYRLGHMVKRIIRHILPWLSLSVYFLHVWTPRWNMGLGICRARGRGNLRKFGCRVRHASWNPFLISDQNIRFSQPYSRPDPKFDTLFQTRPYLPTQEVLRFEQTFEKGIAFPTL